MPDYPIDYSALNRVPTDRVRNSEKFYADVDDALATRPAQPSHTARTRAIPDGLAITVDDGRDSAVEVTSPEPGRVRLIVRDAHGTGHGIDLSLYAVGLVDEALRAVAGSHTVSPIKGSR